MGRPPTSFLGSTRASRVLFGALVEPYRWYPTTLSDGVATPSSRRPEGGPSPSRCNPSTLQPIASHHGRGCGVGRGLGSGVDLGVAIGVGLGVTVEVGVGLGVGVVLGVGVGVGLGKHELTTSTKRATTC